MSGLGLILPGAGGSQHTHIYPDPLGSTAAWPSASQGIFRLFQVDKPTTATGIVVPNGGTVNGNIKVGLYDSDKTTLTQRALSTGDTAMSGGSASQVINFATPWNLVPFVEYYAFMVSDSATATFGRISVAAAAWTLTGRMAYALAAAYTTPPTSQLISGMSSGAAYIPTIAIVTTG